MPDLTSVANSLVAIIAEAVYPNGTGQSSVTGDAIKVFQGWPNQQQLVTDLAAGRVNISVFPRPNDKVTSTSLGDGDWEVQSNDGTLGVSVRELRRQTRQFQITVWAKCFEQRDPVASVVDIALAATLRMTFSDGSQGQLTYSNSAQDDDQQKQGVYRRDLFYSVNYATVQTVNDYAIKEVDLSYSIGPSLDVQGSIVTITNP